MPLFAASNYNNLSLLPFFFRVLPQKFNPLCHPSINRPISIPSGGRLSGWAGPDREYFVINQNLIPISHSAHHPRRAAAPAARHPPRLARHRGGPRSHLALRNGPASAARLARRSRRLLRSAPGGGGGGDAQPGVGRGAGGGCDAAPSRRRIEILMNSARYFP